MEEQNQKYTMFASYHEAAWEYANGDMAVYGRLMYILNSYGIDNVEVADMTPVEKLFFKAVKPNIDQSIKSSTAGKEGKKKAMEKKAETSTSDSTPLTTPPTTPPSLDMDKEKDKEVEKEMDVDVDKTETPLTPLPEDYAKNIFELWTEAKLPCKSDYITFLQTDFKNSLQKLKGIHSDDVIGACKNYISVIQNPNCYYHFNFGFQKFVESKKFSDFLPGNFALINFLKYGVEPTKEILAPPKPKRVIPPPPEICPDCGATLSKDIVLGGCNTWRCHQCFKGWYEWTGEKWEWQE